MAENPFYFNMATKPQDFVGRSALLQEIVDGLESGRPDSYGVVGGRRFGKSSLIDALAYRLREHLKQDVIGGVPVIPVIVSLKGITPTSPSDVFGFACHRIRRATSGRKKLPPLLRGPLVDLGLPDYTQNEPLPASVQGVETAVEEVITAAYNRLGEVRIALILDEIEHTLSYPWTADLFANLRYLIYDSDYKPYIRLIMAGTGKYLGLNEKGSPLFNAITGCFLEAFDADGVAQLLGRAVGLAPDIAQAVALQSGGHPFILQHALHYMVEQNIASCSLAEVHREINRFRLARLTDLQAWWDDIEEEGRCIYHALCLAADWMTVEEIARSVPEDVQKERGLRELICHGFIVHDGSYQRYRVHGLLFRDWFMERYGRNFVSHAILARPFVDDNLDSLKGLKDKLIDELSKLATTDTPHGRTSLLDGIPGVDTLARDQMIKRLDLDLIVTQLAQRGRLSNGHLPIAKLINNALIYANGYEVEGSLRELQEQLK